MRDKNRIPIMLEKLRILWEKHPDLRLGQIVENAKSVSVDKNVPTFTIEDNLIEEGLDWLIERIK
jgi:hypothetical protein